jgi:ABC-type branched-subunit amino acid transport system substrate-binding protein
MRTGIRAALEEQNRVGGIHGRMLRLLAMDDGYEPSRTVPNMRELIADERVVAVIGNVGTPTAIAALPLSNAARMPFFGAFTGAGVLRKDPPERHVINYRASYAEETAWMVDTLLDHTSVKREEIAFFTQRDGYGDAGFSGGIAALRRRGLEDVHRVAHGRYERNSLAVENALADIIQADPPARAVIMVGAYAPCAAFIVIVTQVVPHYDSELAIVVEYRRALEELDPDAEPDFVSLEGYIATRILLLAMSRIQGQVDRESIVDSLEALGRFDIGLGVELELGRREHQACNRIWPTILRGGEFVPLRWEDLERWALQ